MSEKTKRYIVSSVVTFLTGFAYAFLLDIDSITIESFRDGTASGIILVAIRSGFKALLEWFLASTVAK